MPVLPVSTYDLGRQPFGIASPAAWLRSANIDTECVDTSRDELTDDQIAAASLVAFYLPMHTATRIAVRLIERVRRVNPAARICAYGLYAPLNVDWLRACGADHILGPEAESDLLTLTLNTESGSEPAVEDAKEGAVLPRLHFIRPDRSLLPPLARYAAVEMPDGTRRIAGNTDATRGCRHLCLHCPVVPVYQGQFRVVPVDIVIDDIRAQVAGGAQHISFGDPDFFNGPTHARRVVERLAAEFPELTYDVTIKIEHLVKHSGMLSVLHDTGCLFITSAVESIDNDVLLKLRKGHTYQDFVEAVSRCRAARVVLHPTFVPFTPWTTVEGYVALLDGIENLDLVESVSPVQLAIRLLITSGSPLLDLADVREMVDVFDPASLTWLWRHRDVRVDRLQQDVMRVVAAAPASSRNATFGDLSAIARRYAGMSLPSHQLRTNELVPHLNEAWYCCAEPVGGI